MIVSKEFCVYVELSDAIKTSASIVLKTYQYLNKKSVSNIKESVFSCNAIVFHSN